MFHNSFWHYMQTCGFLIFFFFLKIEKLKPNPISSFPPITVSTVKKIQCHSIAQYQIKSNSIRQYQIPIYSIRFWYYYIKFWYCDTIKSYSIRFWYCDTIIRAERVCDMGILCIYLRTYTVNSCKKCADFLWQGYFWYPPTEILYHTFVLPSLANRDLFP